MKLGNFLLGLLLLPLYTFAGVSGTYEIKGFDPISGDYTGTLVIAKVADEIYSATWTFGENATATGTGVRQGGHLSFVFEESFLELPSSAGTQLYDIDSYKLHGPWIRFGATEKGSEVAKKID